MFNFRTSKIGRIINQNMLEIGIGIIVIILVISAMQVLNRAAREENKTMNTATETIDPTSQTMITGSDVPEEENDKNKSVIESFIEYCNMQQIEEAYNLLSIECKEELYPSIEDFQKFYWTPVFKTSKSYHLQSWISNYDTYTYKVNLLKDILAMGQYDSSEIMDDYYTIVKEEGVDKLNINGYVGREEINATQQENEVKIDVIKKQRYMDYEIYTIKIENQSDYDMLLDSQETINGIYLLDENDVKYSAYLDELSEEDFMIPKKESKTITIKFNKLYNPSIKIKSVVFSDMIQDYEIYTVLKNKNKYGGRLKVEIGI